MKAKQAPNRQAVTILLLVVGLIAAAFGAVGLAGGGGVDPYEVRNGIVYVYTTIWDNEGNTESGWGTGWAIGKPNEPVQYIVTNGHVVEKAYTYPKQYTNIGGQVQVYFSVAENNYMQGQVVYYSPPSKKDIAIIKLPSATDKRTALRIRSSASVDVGDTVYALGYPGTATTGQEFLTFDQDDVTLTKGVISKRMTPSFSTYEAFQMDTYISGGNSGGPLVDEKGQVVGINSAGLTNTETGIDLGVNYAITSDNLIKILDSEHIEYTASGLSWARSWFAYVFLPIGMLLLAGGIVRLVSEQKGGQGAAAPAGNASVSAWAGKAPQRGREKRAVLRGVTGKYAGQSFDLLKGKIVIGRDPASCNIVFDKNTPGISGRHCQVAYDPNGDSFMITDMGSSYGTFLGNGKKLTGNVTEKLSAGDTFYLCDNTNRFVVAKE